MLLLYPFSFIFLSFVVIRRLISISSRHILGIWIGLELNILSFIAFSVQRSRLKQIERCIKYFFVQALGSGVWFLGSLLNFFFFGGWIYESLVFNIGLILIYLSLILKLGVAPFFFWVPRVIRHFSWVSCCVLATWQKLIPLFVFKEFLWSGYIYIILFLGGLSALIGGIGGLNQINLRVLMAYSSIGHLGWIISVFCFSDVGGMLYFFTYFICRFSLFCGLWCIEYKSFNQLNRWHMFGISFVVLLGVIFFSLSGVPPFTGFLGKWVGLLVLCDGGLYFLVSVLLVGSLFNLYYYLVVIRNLTIWSGVWNSFVVYEIFSFKNNFYFYMLLFLIFLSVSGLIGFYFFI